MKHVEHMSDSVALYLGDCREILPRLGKIDAVVSDPPYGLGDLLRKGGATEWSLMRSDCVLWDETTVGELESIIREFEHAIIWGGAYYALPPRRGWLIWDKIVRNFSSGHCEMAWTTLDQPVRAFNFATTSLISGNNQFAKEHPTQKPLPLMEWCIGFLPSEASVADPFMGSGTTGVACVRMGRRFSGIEIEPRYFDIACRRIADELKRPRLDLTPAPKAEQQSLFRGDCP
ncbi:MAG: site-specific DNA-methyltransferase [Bosea sp.]|uniref:DNA-methyltransferase n=1 Tax=Bosea sp. (in: a-proteobacteria) TaxID=1871050 RepID=UPI001AC515A4|nr:DNA methyltransferase [Bosea sp. (in: a-proteobacteria)]MBN9453295.1 site-specific DNA-methyltransferase [Bosea sp. (in: a-proteobacteria)]